MPRPGDRRPVIGVRLSEAGIEQLDKLGEDTDRGRSDVIRILLSEALKSAAVVRAARKRLMELTHAEPRRTPPRRLSGDDPQ